MHREKEKQRVTYICYAVNKDKEGDLIVSSPVLLSTAEGKKSEQKNIQQYAPTEKIYKRNTLQHKRGSWRSLDETEEEEQ